MSDAGGGRRRARRLGSPRRRARVARRLVPSGGAQDGEPQEEDGGDRDDERGHVVFASAESPSPFRGRGAYVASNVAIRASATTFSGLPESWLARRRRSNASCSVRPSFAMSTPFARSIALRAASASASDSASARSACSSSWRARAVWIAGSRSCSRNGLTRYPKTPGLDRARDDLVLAVGGDHDDRYRPLLEDAPGGFDAVEARHLHVHDGEVWLELARQLDRLDAVARLTADLEAGLLEQRAQIEADDRLVLGDEDSHAGALSSQTWHTRVCTSSSRLKSGGGMGWPRRHGVWVMPETPPRRAGRRPDSSDSVPPSSSRTSARTMDRPVPCGGSPSIPSPSSATVSTTSPSRPGELDVHALPAVLERVLEELGEHERERRRAIAADRHRLEDRLDALARRQPLHEHPAQPLEQLAHVDVVLALLRQHLVHGGDREHAIDGVLERLPRIDAVRSRLEAEQRGHGLEVVLHPVVNLLSEDAAQHRATVLERHRSVVRDRREQLALLVRERRVAIADELSDLAALPAQRKTHGMWRPRGPPARRSSRPRARAQRRSRPPPPSSSSRSPPATPRDRATRRPPPRCAPAPRAPPRAAGPRRRASRARSRTPPVTRSRRAARSRTT